VDSVTTPPPRPRSTPPKSFVEVCRRLGLVAPEGDARVTGVAINATQVLPGDLFVALPGRVHHGALFVAEAIESGAVAVITDQAGQDLLGQSPWPVAVHPRPREVLGQISREVYSSSTPLPKILAVTGTNGKTSVTFFLEEVCRRLGQTTALSNSTLRRVGNEEFRTKLTTPEANEIHSMLALGAEKGVETFCLEASAQAIERHRLDGLRIAVAGFTNLSHDHFEDYGDMESYLAQKAALFDPALTDRSVICLDTEWGQKLAGQLTVPVTTLAAEGGPGSAGRPADWTYAVQGSDGDTTGFVLTGPEGQLTTRVAALGSHMVANAALAIVMVHASGIPFPDLRGALSPPQEGLTGIVPGRIERVSGTSPISVYLDAGRSPDAYQHTLDSLRQVSAGRLIMVCGTSGNRDASKRPIMGRLAAEGADVVIVTDDDPRFEDPAQIRSGLLEGARSPGGRATEILEVPEPAEAIDRAISLAVPGDVIVWCGPGSQNYREIQGERIPFSAREEARRALHRRGLLSELPA
jgi:UDP-N-acetylmuramoyl-L-alanyl-D-glutamate--2,6-diaminopimelate ligase